MPVSTREKRCQIWPYPDAASCSIPSLSPSICPLVTPTRLFLWQQQNPVQACERRLCFSAYSARQQASGFLLWRASLLYHVSFLLFLPGSKMEDERVLFIKAWVVFVEQANEPLWRHSSITFWAAYLFSNMSVFSFFLTFYPSPGSTHVLSWVTVGQLSRSLSSPSGCCCTCKPAQLSPAVPPRCTGGRRTAVEGEGGIRRENAREAWWVVDFTGMCSVRCWAQQQSSRNWG